MYALFLTRILDIRNCYFKLYNIYLSIKHFEDHYKDPEINILGKIFNLFKKNHEVVKVKSVFYGT